MKSQGQTVFVGLSGGVDSSVSAALLKRAGFEVTGVFIKVWQPDFFSAAGGSVFGGECQWKDDRLDAMRVCAKLSIPFRELNLEKEYKRDVVDYMIREYMAGRTPNPDVSCNRFIKFGAFYKWARREGADFVATGHYARIEHDANTLMVANDANKDQSYFLWQIRKEQLPHILFPVGGMKKPYVRRLAKKFGLITAEKRDSQGLCFLGKVEMKDFLKHFVRVRPGRVLDRKGRVIGRHEGALFYTLGQRHGFSIANTSPDDPPLYVVSKDMKRNTITVAPRAAAGDPFSQEVLRIRSVNWIAGQAPNIRKRYAARIRYRQPLQPCRIASLSARGCTVRFEEAQQAVTAGQSLVLYDGAICLGGGIIV